MHEIFQFLATYRDALYVATLATGALWAVLRPTSDKPLFILMLAGIVPPFLPSLAALA